jgi:hypothetical protein
MNLPTNKEVMMHKPMIDGAAALTAVGTVFHYMPEIAALFTVVWYSIRFVEYIRTKKASE